MLFEFKSWITDKIIISLDAATQKAAVEDAVKQMADLQGAHLQGADLRGADLRGAHLRGAHLRGAHLRGADLRGADLQGADLQGAHLRGAHLREADLQGADLRGAHLREADLQGAHLREIRDDLWAVLSGAPAEVPDLRAALVAGQIDGTAYYGPCACLVGTLAKARGCGIHDLPDVHADSGRTSERWFLGIQPGDTPETSAVVAQTLAWVDTWLGNMRAAFGTTTDMVICAQAEED